MKPADEKQLESHLRELKLGEFVANYADFARSAALNQASYTDFLSHLAEQEVQVRTARRRERRLKEAKLPLLKRFDSFDFTLIPSLNQSLIWQLQDCRYLDAKQSVICIGAPGLGKTHIATALAVAAGVRAWFPGRWRASKSAPPSASTEIVCVCPDSAATSSAFLPSSFRTSSFFPPFIISSAAYTWPAETA